MRRRLFIFGLDAGAPDLIFNKFIDYLPNFKKVIGKGVYGRLRSCDPPITVPAWMVMMTGREPGELGLYGFRHRKEYSYSEISIPNSGSIRYPRIWDILGGEGFKTFVLGVPPSYPPYKVNGWLIGCFLTPDDRVRYTYPLTLKYEVNKIVDKYIFDVPFRRDDRDWVLDKIHEMTNIHFKVVDYMMTSKNWDFFMYMEIGLDRIQHAFWKYMDLGHRRYEYHERYSKAILEYYIELDQFLGKIIGDAGASDILIVSDHGAKKMDGAFAVNQWLIDKGYLKLKGDVKPGSRLSQVDIDWGDSIAWGWGGYYGRIFLNIEGREEKGVISPNDYEYYLNKLSSEIKSIRGPSGESWRNLVYKPSDLYHVVNGSPPDLMVYFDDLNWRSAGTVGYETPYLEENDTGPDDAVHDYDGVFIWYSADGRLNNSIELDDISIYDVYPTILRYYGLEAEEAIGTPIEEVLVGIK